MATARNNQYLESVRRGLAESVAFFSGMNKANRERWVCRELVRNLGVRAWERSFESPDRDPPDVIYRGFRFEVKEVLDPGRQRHREYREALAEAQAASDGKDLIRPYTPKYITPHQVGELISPVLAALEHKYEPRLQQSLDLVFYLNLSETSLEHGEMPESCGFEVGNWRSVAVLIGWSTLVFSAKRSAPLLFRRAAGRVVTR
jgi:hypothetical protein